MYNVPFLIIRKLNSQSDLVDLFIVSQNIVHFQSVLKIFILKATIRKRFYLFISEIIINLNIGVSTWQTFPNK